MKITAALIFLFISNVNLAQNKGSKDFNLSSSNLAVQGYDVVSYFSGTLTKGREYMKSEVLGVVYYFSSEQNKTFFDKNPKRYIPKYGGWCAYAMAKGEQVEVNPEAYLIQNDSLYLFFKTYFINTQTKWQAHPEFFQEKADANWNQ